MNNFLRDTIYQSSYKEKQVTWLSLHLSKKLNNWFKIFQNRKFHTQIVSLGEFYQTFKEQMIPVLCNCVQRIESEGVLPNSLYEVSITLISKLQNITRKTTSQFSHGYRYKDLQDISKSNYTLQWGKIHSKYTSQHLKINFNRL